MHIAPGHEEVAKEQGWNAFNADYFREHSGQTMTDALAAKRAGVEPKEMWRRIVKRLAAQ
jgi:hypothetical protein